MLRSIAFWICRNSYRLPVSMRLRAILWARGYLSQGRIFGPYLYD